MSLSKLNIVKTIKNLKIPNNRFLSAEEIKTTYYNFSSYDIKKMLLYDSYQNDNVINLDTTKIDIWKDIANNLYREIRKKNDDNTIFLLPGDSPIKLWNIMNFKYTINVNHINFPLSGLNMQISEYLYGPKSHAYINKYYFSKILFMKKTFNAKNIIKIIKNDKLYWLQHEIRNNQIILYGFPEKNEPYDFDDFDDFNDFYDINVEYFDDNNEKKIEKYYITVSNKDDTQYITYQQLKYNLNYYIKYIIDTSGFNVNKDTKFILIDYVYSGETSKLIQKSLNQLYQNSNFDIIDLKKISLTPDGKWSDVTYWLDDNDGFDIRSQYSLNLKYVFNYTKKHKLYFERNKKKNELDCFRSNLIFYIIFGLINHINLIKSQIKSITPQYSDKILTKFLHKKVKIYYYDYESFEIVTKEYYIEHQPWIYNHGDEFIYIKIVK